jgi:DNA-binding IclR family transcriptional regulator
MSTAKLKKQVLQLLAEQPLTLREVSEKMGLTEKRAYNLLRSLFQEGRIKSNSDAQKQRRYSVDETHKKSEEEEGEEEIEPN